MANPNLGTHIFHFCRRMQNTPFHILKEAGPLGIKQDIIQFHPSFFGRKHLRSFIRDISSLSGNLADAVRRILLDAPPVIQDAIHRPSGDAGKLRNFFHCRHSILSSIGIPAAKQHFSTVCLLNYTKLMPLVNTFLAFFILFFTALPCTYAFIIQLFAIIFKFCALLL